MGYVYLRCKECGVDNDIYCDGDNAMMCPECTMVDEFEEVIQCMKCDSAEGEMLEIHDPIYGKLQGHLCDYCNEKNFDKSLDKKLCNFCNGSGEGYYSNESKCIHCSGRGVCDL